MAALLAATMAYDVWRVPVQVYDSLIEILDAQRSPSVAASFRGSLDGAAYLRPARIAQIKAIYDASGDHLRVGYRGFHVALLLAFFWLFARALRVESGRDASAAVFALTVVTGLHTFSSFMREAFPINHFLEIAVLTLVALNLAISRGGWWVDALAALAFIVASLTLESGLLVWVVFAAARISGMRGVSTRGLVLVTALLVGYVGIRAWYLQIGVPALSERSSGFLLERLEPDELERRFGSALALFRAYNVGTSFASVLFAEPREGLFEFVRAWRDDSVAPRLYLALASSIATTGLIGASALAWWRRPSQWGHGERLAFIALAVLAANAVLSFSYTKDDIMTVGGVFYAFAAYAALRALLAHAASWRAWRVAVLSVALLALSGAWAMRSVGVHHVMVTQAFKTRNDWARLPVAWAREQPLPSAPAALAVIERLRNDAIEAEVPNPQLLPPWRDRWWGDR